MCAIDWSALGTWAAVLIALAIAVGDKVTAHFRRRRASKILAILSENEIVLTRIRLQAISDEINPKEAEWMYEHLLAVNDSVRTNLKDLGDKLKIPIIDQAIERLPDLDGRLALTLTQGVAKVRSVAFGTLDPARTPPGDTFPDSAEFCENLRGEVADAIEYMDKSFLIGQLIIRTKPA